MTPDTNCLIGNNPHGSRNVSKTAPGALGDTLIYVWYSKLDGYYDAARCYKLAYKAGHSWVKSRPETQLLTDKVELMSIHNIRVRAKHKNYKLNYKN